MDITPMKILALTVASVALLFDTNMVFAQDKDVSATRNTPVLRPVLVQEARSGADRKISHVDLPGFDYYTYKVDPFIRAAGALQALGQKQAMQELLAFAKEPGKRFEDRYGAFVLCRMLFTPKEGKRTEKQSTTFRRPGIGAAVYVGAKSIPGNVAEWPLEPIELIDGVPFLITKGYYMQGQAELPTEYIKYCIQNCDWNSVAFKPKSEHEKKAALAKLMSVHKLKPFDREFLSPQIK